MQEPGDSTLEPSYPARVAKQLVGGLTLDDLALRLANAERRIAELEARLDSQLDLTEAPRVAAES